MDEGICRRVTLGFYDATGPDCIALSALDRRSTGDILDIPDGQGETRKQGETHRLSDSEIRCVSQVYNLIVVAREAHSPAYVAEILQRDKGRTVSPYLRRATVGFTTR